MDVNQQSAPAPSEAAAAPASSESFDNAPDDVSADSTLDSVDDIADAFLAGSNGDSNSNAGEPAANEGDAKPAEQQAEAQQGQAVDAPAEVPMPEGFDANTWATLSPEVRTALDAREKAHAQALSQERQQSAQVRAERNQQVNAAAVIAQRYDALFRKITQAEFAGVDWDRLAQTDPATYVQLSRQYQNRIRDIETLAQQTKQAAQAIGQRRNAEKQAGISNEIQVLEPKLKAIIGDGYNRKQFVSDAVKYLDSCGVPRDAASRISKGYEVELVAKAMLYDRQQAARASAQKKVAEAPRVQAPSGRQAAEGNTRQRNAMSALRKNPKSTDAIAEAFLAME